MHAQLEMLYLIPCWSAYRWSVGKLSEMPPEGKVGVSPVCILGVNINAGQEISLRLRTDDLRGFRRYGRIRETLIHELAHMVGCSRPMSALSLSAPVSALTRLCFMNSHRFEV